MYYPLSSYVMAPAAAKAATMAAPYGPAAKALAMGVPGALLAGAVSYGRRRNRGRSAPSHSTLGGPGGYRGGAAPIPSKTAGATRARAKARTRKAQKCRSMKGAKLSKEVCSLKNQIKGLKQSENASLGLLTRREMSVSRTIASANLQNSDEFSINTPTNVESVLAGLQYYDPSVPATLVTASASTGTYNKNFLVKSVYSQLKMRNNYQTDVELIAYLCTPKSDSSISPGAAWIDGIENDPGSVVAKTEYGSYPTDYDAFNDLWSVKRACHKTLSPGESTTVSHAVPSYEYDPSLVDEHTSTYQRRYKVASWLVIVRGTLSHDTTLDQQGFCQAGIDVVKSTTWKISYDAGVNLKILNLSTTFDTPTNGFVQSHQPLSDNLAYSAA